MTLLLEDICKWVEGKIKLEKLEPATPLLIKDLSEEIESKRKEIKDYYEQVHPDRVVYVKNMDKLRSELASLVNQNNMILDQNRAERESKQVEYEQKSTSIRDAIKPIEDKVTLYREVVVEK